MKIVEADTEYLDTWVEMRRALWDGTQTDQEIEAQEVLEAANMKAYLLIDDHGQPAGFIEGAIYAEAGQNYGYVEGWYVKPEYRKQGYGGQLLDALEEWILHQSITTMLSDTIPDEYPLSKQAHTRNGYKKLKTIQVFIKQLKARE